MIAGFVGGVGGWRDPYVYNSVGRCYLRAEVRTAVVSPFPAPGSQVVIQRMEKGLRHFSDDTGLQDMKSQDRKVLAASLSDLRSQKMDHLVVERVDELILEGLRKELNLQIYSEFMKSLKTLEMYDRMLSEWQYLQHSNAVLQPHVYMTIATGLAKGNYLEQAVAVAEEMMKRGFKISDGNVITLVNYCIRAGNTEQAILCLWNCLDNNIVPGRSVFLRILNHCIKTKCAKMAVQMTMEMRIRGLPAESSEYNNLFNLLTHQKLFDLAWVLLQDVTKLTEIQLYEKTCSRLTAASAKCLSTEKTDLFKEKLETLGFKCTRKTYAALLNEATKTADLERSLAVYSEMLARGVKPTRDVSQMFTSLIGTCGKVRRLEKAFDIHEHMTLCGIKPNISSFNALINGCRQAGDVEKMKQVVEMMEYSGINADIVTYSSLVDAYGRIGRVEDAFATVDTMINNGVEPNLVTYTHLINAAVRAGHMDAAFKVFELIEERKMKPNVFTYSVLINGLTKRGELSRAMALLEQMRSNGVRPSLVTFATLLKSCSRLYDAHIMRDIIERMQADLKLREHGLMKDLSELCQQERLPLNPQDRSKLEYILRQLGRRKMQFK